MRKPSILSVVVVAAMGAAAPATARAAGILIDHTTTDAGELSQSALDAARALTMSFSHASVGGDMWAGLGLLRTDSSTRYSFPSWTDVNRGNPGWQAKVDDFETYVAEHGSSFQVFLNKFCWIDQDASFTYYRDSMVELATDYPTRTLVWFTMPLYVNGTDNAKRASFNASVRAYAADHGVPLFDLADIESHEPSGAAHTEGGREALYDAYSSDGGHLNDAGRRRTAGAIWHLMAQLAASPPVGPACGNGTCETGESAASCAANCSSPQPGSGSGGGGCGSASPGGLGGAAALLAGLLAGLGLRRRSRLPG